MIDCEFCDGSMEEGSNFCRWCGTPVNEDLAEKEAFWIKFSAEVAAKAIPEAIDEYGDFSDDTNLDSLSAKELIRKLRKIVDEYAEWGWDDNDDLLHLAHLVALIYYKCKEKS